MRLFIDSKCDNHRSFTIGMNIVVVGDYDIALVRESRLMDGTLKSLEYS